MRLSNGNRHNLATTRMRFRNRWIFLVVKSSLQACHVWPAASSSLNSRSLALAQPNYASFAMNAKKPYLHDIAARQPSLPSRFRCHTHFAFGRRQLRVYVLSQKFHDANFPTSQEGRTYHLGTKKGEVANRILTVGSTQRAEMLSKLLQPAEPGKPLFQNLSSRGFITITGQYNGIPVSIVSHLMGMPNMDFMVRECRAVVEGQMAIVRLGTCGAIQPTAKLGDLLIASLGSINIRRNPDAWTLGDGTPAYTFTLPVPADQGLAAAMVSEANALMGEGNVVQGLNATADSFYSSQGRLGTVFDDRNHDLIGDLCKKYPKVVSLEMETFQLLDLARCSGGSVRAIGMCIALAERYSNRFLDYEKLERLERLGGTVALNALSKLQLENDVAELPVLSQQQQHHLAAGSNGHTGGVRTRAAESVARW